MGFFLSSIKEEYATLSEKILPHAHPYDRVREYHGIFKSVCDNFVIKPSQFQQIFGSEESFGFWSSDSINALQLFCGLAFFATDCSFRAKVRFLFGLFDFNEIKSISIVDLEYMLLSVCNFSYKVLGKINTKADQLKLAEWLLKYLDPHKRVTVTRLYRLCGQALELEDFLGLAGATRKEFEEAQVLQQEPGAELAQKGDPQGERDDQVTSKLVWFSLLCAKLAKPKYKKQVVTNTELSWVYGIELDKIRQSFLALDGPIVIYAVSNKMVVFNEQTNCQRIYCEHQRQITCFCLLREDKIVASAQGSRRPHIYIWNYEGLETIHILRLDHTQQVSHMTFSQKHPILAVAAQRKASPLLLFQTISWTLKTSFSHSESIKHLSHFFTNIPQNQVLTFLWGYFIVCGTHQLSIINEAGIICQTSYECQVTALAVSYMNCVSPYLRYFHADNLRIFVVTGHASGSITVWQVPSENALQGAEIEKVEILRMDEPIKQLVLTEQTFFVVCGSEIRVYDLNVLTGKQNQDEVECRCIKLSDYEELKLLSHVIHCISVTNHQICVLTEQGDFVIVGDRQIVNKNDVFVEQESLRRVNTIVKFKGEMRAMCFLERQLHNLLLVVSGGTRILQIDSEKHEVAFVLDIGINDFVTVIDSAVSQEGGGLIACGCKSGKLILRNDWAEMAKVMDCGAEILDLKISPEGGTLLVATMNTLLFFHLGSALSSPRKLTFENESPISLGFLDNSKFCAITTSAKNIYLLQLPSLKHRNVFKDVDTFSSSRLPIAFPLPIEKMGIPAQCMVGGDINFYLICLNDGGILFFPSMSSLEQNNYLMLQGHKCPIANLSVCEDQKAFYTLGQTDQMLLQWKVKELKPIFSTFGQKMKYSRSQMMSADWESMFRKMRRVSEAPVEPFDHSLSTFFFRGTKQKKLNRKLRLESDSQYNLTAEEVALSKRHSNFSLQTRTVYGLQTDKINQILYRNKNLDDSTILYSASRFLVEISIDNYVQQITECNSKMVGFVALNDQDEVLWSEVGSFPWIWKNNRRCLKTKHSEGLIHFAIYKDLILSYGISQKAYTLNLHNYRTQQLLAERTTDKQILSFLMLNQRQFISLAQVRWWKDFVQSEVLGLANSGVILSNGNDICLGGFSGSISVLSANGMVEIAHQAHGKEITVMKNNVRQGHYQLVTASLDETIRIWNKYFEQLLVINLTFQEEFSLLHEIKGQPAKSPLVFVSSLDCKGSHVIASFAHGQIWQFIITSSFEKITEGVEVYSQNSLPSDQSQMEISKLKQTQTDKKHLVYKVENHKLLDSHCSGSAPAERYLAFDVHPNFSILATAGNDGRLILRDYERNMVLANYFCDDRKQVRALRFSPFGRMLIVGLSGGVIMTFYLCLTLDSKDDISQLTLKHFQTFKPERFPTQIVDIELNQTGQYFCVSYWNEPRQKMSNQANVKNVIRIFRMKSEKNSNSDQAFYEQRQIIQIREEQKSNTGVSKCVLRMHWQKQQDKQCIIMYSQNISSQSRYKLSHKGKYQVYCLEEKGYLSDQFSVSWTHGSFPNLLHTLIVGPNGEAINQDYCLTAAHEFQDTLFCGGIDGRLHLVKNQALLSEQSVVDYKQDEMCLSRVYNSHSSFITRVLASESQATGKKYLFTTAYGDQTLVEFQIIEENPNFFLQHQAYPREVSDDLLHGQCPSRQRFYLLLNNRQPLREQLTAVLEDVQKSVGSAISLSPVRLFGRRASDRRYNLSFFQNKALYSLGPNMIIQSLTTPGSQEIMKADPSPFSHCPEISTFHYQGRWLGVVTEEEHSSLFVWDIRSQSCLSSMHLQCSVVFMLRFSGDSSAILYGLNDRYQLVVQLVDWRARKSVGRVRFAQSGNVAIRDICTYSGKTNGLQFITCGYLHLCYWQLRGDQLIHHNFNTMNDAKYLCVRSLNNCIITGCQEGSLYLWVDFEMVHCLSGAHSAAVRCLQADFGNDVFFSGGKDGMLLFLKIEDSRIKIFNRANLSENSVKYSSPNIEQFAKSWKVEHQIQAIAINSQQDNERKEKILVGTRSGAIYQVSYSDDPDSAEISLLFEGHDHQAIVGATFSNMDPSYFYTLSNAGIIEKWSLVTLKKQFSFELGRKALKLQSCGGYLLICCRNQVMVYRAEHDSLFREQQLCIDTRRCGENQGEESKESEIIKMCLSQNHLNLAVCIKICSKEPIYQISLYEFGKSRDPYHTLSNLKHEIDYIDFSLDDKYFLFKDKYEEIGMINLDSEKDYRRINTIFVEMAIEWQEEGLRISPKGQKIYYSYSCENKITTITRLGKDKIIVGDEMGTVRIFDYPCPDDRLGELHLFCYSNHMNDIQIIRVHPGLSHVITTALQDRSLILWKVDHCSSNEAQ